MTSDAALSIPEFALDGKITPIHRHESVHIEDIHERSSRNDWVIKPHRHEYLFQLLLMQSGDMTMTLDDEQRQLQGAWLLIAPAGVVHGYRFSPDVRGKHLSIPVNEHGVDAENQIPRLLNGVLAKPSVLQLDLTSAFFAQLELYLGLLTSELQLSQQDQNTALNAVVKLLLVLLRRHLGQQHAQHLMSHRQLPLLDRLRDLVESHYREHWEIADYSHALHVSVSTLNRACREQLGCAVKKLLQDRLHVEARRRLIYTQDTVNQIADNLGYHDTAYFSRVFKALEGLTPSEFRKQRQP